MYEINLQYLSYVLIAISVGFRPLIFKKFNFKGIMANIIYFCISMIIIIPFNLYQPKFTLASIDKEFSKKLIVEALKTPVFNDYENIKNIDWEPYSEKDKLYNIKATIHKNNKPYTLFLQPYCNFNEGCQVYIDKILLFEEESNNLSIDNLTKQSFLKRSCNDVISKDILKNTIKLSIDKYMEGMNKVNKFNFKYDIKSIDINKVSEISDTVDSIKFNNLEYKFSNSCEANFTLKSYFEIEGASKKPSLNILKNIFNIVEENNKIYNIRSDMKYYIFTREGDISVRGNPFKASR